jgi:hypothetical protein
MAQALTRFLHAAPDGRCYSAVPSQVLGEERQALRKQSASPAKPVADGSIQIGATRHFKRESRRKVKRP